MQLALDQHLVVPEEASFFMNMGQYKKLINYSHTARRPWISLNTSWSSSILASHQEPINALELSTEILGVEPQIDDKVFKLIWVEAGGVIKINL